MMLCWAYCGICLKNMLPFIVINAMSETTYSLTFINFSQEKP